MAEQDTYLDVDLVVVGGGIASLVAALTSGNAGARVALLLPPHGVGAGFSSLTEGQYQLDVGCRRFDFTSDEAVADLGTYKPGLRVRPFAHHVRSFIEETLEMELVATSAPSISYGGKLAPDLATSLDLTSLTSLLSPEDIQCILKETDSILTSSPPSPITMGMGNWPDLSSSTLQEASLANHGPTFHARLIAPFAQKLDPTSWSDVPADLTTKIWTPLFFPRTINQGCRGRLERDRPPVTYFYPSGGHFGDFVEHLLSKIKRQPNIQTVQGFVPQSISRQDQDIVATAQGGSVYRWSSPFVLGTSVDLYCRLAGLSTPIEKLALGVIWVDVSEDDLRADPSTIMVHDADTSVYRISVAGTGASDGRVILALEMTGGSDECDASNAASVLYRLGVLRTGADVAEVRRETSLKIVAPSTANRALLRQAHDVFDQGGIDAIRVATLNDLKADMLNDQTLQGLTIGHQFS